MTIRIQSTIQMIFSAFSFSMMLNCFLLAKVQSRYYKSISIA